MNYFHSSVQSERVDPQPHTHCNFQGERGALKDHQYFGFLKEVEVEIDGQGEGEGESENDEAASENHLQMHFDPPGEMNVFHCHRRYIPPSERRACADHRMLLGREDDALEDDVYSDEDHVHMCYLPLNEMCGDYLS